MTKRIFILFLFVFQSVFSCHHEDERVCLRCLGTRAVLHRERGAQQIDGLQVFRCEKYQEYQPHKYCEHINVSMPDATDDEKKAEARRIYDVFKELRATHDMDGVHPYADGRFVRSDAATMVSDYLSRCGLYYIDVISEIHNPDSTYIPDRLKFLGDNPFISTSTEIKFKYMLDKLPADWYFNDHGQMVNSKGEILSYIGQIRSAVFTKESLESGDIFHYNEDLIKDEVRRDYFMKNHEIGFFGSIPDDNLIPDLLIQSPDINDVSFLQNGWQRRKLRGDNGIITLIENAADNHNESEKVLKQMVKNKKFAAHVRQSYNRIALNENAVGVTHLIGNSYDISRNHLYLDEEDDESTEE